MRFLFFALFIFLAPFASAQEHAPDQGIDNISTREQSADKSALKPGEPETGIESVAPAQAILSLASLLGEGLAQWTMAITGVLALCVSAWAVWLVRRSLELTREATNAAVDAAKEAGRTTRAQFRPRIRVGLVTVTPYGDQRFSSGKPIEASVDVINVGGFPAEIFRSHGQIWVGADLPMVRPYEDSTSTDIFGVRTLEPGTSCQRPFESISLTDDQITSITSGTAKLYVMGWIRYRDAELIPRRTMFCRVFCPNRDRFFPTKDPDYEVEN